MATTTEKKASPAKAMKKAPASAAKASRAKRPELASVANVVLVPLADLVTDQNIREAMDEAALQELARDIQREDLSLLEEGRALLALRNEGMNLGALAELVNKSRSWVCKRIACVENIPWMVAEVMQDGTTEDPEIILALKDLFALDWWQAKLAIERLRAGEENRDSLRELVRKAKEPKADLVGQMENEGGDTAAKLRQTDADASPEVQAKREAEQEQIRREQAEIMRRARINRQCSMYQILNLATLEEEPTEEQFEIYAKLEPEARVFWSEVISDALGGDLFEKMMQRAAVAALEEEPDVLPVMLWVAMQAKPIPETEEEVLRGFVQGFRGRVVSHAKRER